MGSHRNKLESQVVVCVDHRIKAINPWKNLKKKQKQKFQCGCLPFWFFAANAKHVELSPKKPKRGFRVWPIQRWTVQKQSIKSLTHHTVTRSVKLAQAPTSSIRSFIPVSLFLPPYPNCFPMNYYYYIWSKNLKNKPMTWIFVARMWRPFCSFHQPFGGLVPLDQNDRMCFQSHRGHFGHFKTPGLGFRVSFI